MKSALFALLDDDNDVNDDDDGKIDIITQERLVGVCCANKTARSVCVNESNNKISE